MKCQSLSVFYYWRFQGSASSVARSLWCLVADVVFFLCLSCCVWCVLPSSVITSLGKNELIALLCVDLNVCASVKVCFLFLLMSLLGVSWSSGHLLYNSDVVQLIFVAKETHTRRQTERERQTDRQRQRQRKRERERAMITYLTETVRNALILDHIFQHFVSSGLTLFGWRASLVLHF